MIEYNKFESKIIIIGKDKIILNVTRLRKTPMNELHEIVGILLKKVCYLSKEDLNKTATAKSILKMVPMLDEDDNYEVLTKTDLYVGAEGDMIYESDSFFHRELGSVIRISKGGKFVEQVSLSMLYLNDNQLFIHNINKMLEKENITKLKEKDIMVLYQLYLENSIDYMLFDEFNEKLVPLFNASSVGTLTLEEVNTIIEGMSNEEANNLKDIVIKCNEEFTRLFELLGDGEFISSNDLLFIDESTRVIIVSLYKSEISKIGDERIE